MLSLLSQTTTTKASDMTRGNLKTWVNNNFPQLKVQDVHMVDGDICEVETDVVRFYFDETLQCITVTSMNDNVTTEMTSDLPFHADDYKEVNKVIYDTVHCK